MPRRAAVDDPTPINAVVMPEDSELADLVKQFPAAKRVSVSRYNRNTDRWAHLGNVPVDVFSEDMIQRRWGGGLFQARFRNEQGHIIHSINALEIEADPERPPIAAPDVDQAPFANKPAAIAAPTGDGAVLTLMLAELQANRQMMLEMIRGIADRPAAPQLDLVSMVNALGALQGLQPKPSTPLPEKIVERLLEAGMAGKLPNGNGGGNEWIGLIKDVLVEFKPAIRSALVQSAAAAPAPAPIAALPAAAIADKRAADEEGEEDVDGTDAAIVFLKSKYSKGAKPAELVPVVLAFVDGSQLDALLAKPDAVIFTELNDPDFLEPGLRVWMIALLGGLRAIRGLPNPGGTTGDEANNDANGRTG